MTNAWMVTLVFLTRVASHACATKGVRLRLCVTRKLVDAYVAQMLRDMSVTHAPVATTISQPVVWIAVATLMEQLMATPHAFKTVDSACARKISRGELVIHAQVGSRHFQLETQLGVRHATARSSAQILVNLSVTHFPLSASVFHRPQGTAVTAV